MLVTLRHSAYFNYYLYIFVGFFIRNPYQPFSLINSPFSFQHLDQLQLFMLPRELFFHQTVQPHILFNTCNMSLVTLYSHQQTTKRNVHGYSL